MADDDTLAASVQGLARCLRMLTEEAASLNLMQTVAALQDALAACVSDMTAVDDTSFDMMSYDFGRAGMTLH